MINSGMDLPGNILALVAEDCFRGRVEFNDPAVLIDGNDGVESCFKDRRLAEFAFLQRFRGPVPFEILSDLTADVGHGL